MKEVIRGSRILLVDDQPTNLAVLYETLDQFNCTVIIAQNGEEGLRLAQNEHPDIILLDVMMPGMDGYEVCRILKSSKATRDIPVIFVSALTETIDMMRAFDVGAVDYISKPIRSGEVIARVSAHLTIRRQHERLLRFFSIIAHDLRSPFHSLLGATRLLVEDDDIDGESRKEILETLYENADRTYRLTINLLEWGRLQERDITDKLITQDLAPIVDGAVDAVRAQAQDKGHHIEVNVSGDLVVTVDRHMMETVVRNLLSNATKFTPKGGTISIDAEKRGDEVELRVSDTGVGMGDDEIEDLFRIDKRTRRNGTEDEQGTGLGLLLCKEMLTLQHGHMSVESGKGEGTTFRVSIPIHARSDEPEDS